MKSRILCALIGAALLLSSCGSREETKVREAPAEESAVEPLAEELSPEDRNFTVDIVPDEPITGSFSFTVDCLDPGGYQLEAKCSYSGGADLCYLYVDEDGEGENEPDYASVPVCDGKSVFVKGINVPEGGGTVEVGAHIDSGLEDRLMITSISIRPDASAGRELLYGGALSRINYVESTGALFYDEAGEQVDPVAFMADSGMNFCRLELYNHPGKGRGDGTYYCPDGFQDTDDILNIAKRASDAGMEIELTFMFSDFWTYGIPEDFRKDIEGVADESKIVEILEADTYTFVKGVMEKMKAQGTVPLYVSLGNEMSGGFFLPYGESYTHMDYLTRFINAGYEAVKDVSPESQVVLHIACNADDTKWSSKRGTGVWFFGECQKYGVKYDVIGTSFYPFWAENRKVDHLVEWCDLMIDRFDKDVLIMETGFNYRKYTETGSRGQLENMGAYEGVYDYTPEGQRDYMIELINGIKSVKDGRCLGFLYWDPIMVAGSGIGWSIKESTDKADKNVISNTTWFDLDHKALKVFDALRYN